MATSVQTLIQRTQRMVRDWPSLDTTTGALTSSATSLGVANGTLYTVNKLIDVELETMRVTAVSSNTLTVLRGQLGSTASAHSSGTSVLVHPRFPQVQYLDAIADAVDAAFPYVYKRVTDTSLATVANTFEYTLPAMPSDSEQIIPFIWKVDTKRTGELDYVEVRGGAWSIVRQATPKLRFSMEPEPGSTIRLHGYGHFPRLDAVADTLDTDWPRNLEYPLCDYAASVLLASGEYGRVSVDRGMVDDREQANKVGSSATASQYGLQRYLRRVQQSGYPPMSRHAKRVI